MDRIVLSVDIEGIGTRRVNVRRDLHVRNLIDEVRGKFNIEQGTYGLRLDDQPLAPDRTLEQLGIPDGAQLVFCPETQRKSDAELMIEAGERLPISLLPQVYLEEEREGLLYELGWQPAIIGRADRASPAKNKLLAVDLTSLRGSEFVSRNHACITEINGQYYIEGLSKRNPTYVNNEPLQTGEPYILQPGDRVRIGRIDLIFHMQG